MNSDEEISSKNICCVYCGANIQHLTEYCEECGKKINSAENSVINSALGIDSSKNISDRT
jgi:predicted amidophosphoribosyltransferase